MSSTKSEYRLFDFSGGLNTRDAQHLIADNELHDGENVELGSMGVVTRRRAVVATGSYGRNTSSPNRPTELDGPIQGQHVYRLANGTKQYLCVAAGKMYARTSIDNNWGTPIATGLNQSEDVCFYTVNNYCYMINGKDYARRYDGTTVTTVTSIPLGKYAAVLHNRVFIAGMDANPARVDYSDIAAAETFGGTSWFPANYGTMGDNVMGLAIFYDYLIIARRQSMHRIDVSDEVTSANWVYQIINDRYGCVSGKTLSVFGDTLMFASDDGVYALSPTNVESHVNIAKISGKIDPTYEKFINKHLMAAISFGQKYYLAVCDDGAVNNCVYVYNYQLKCWYPKWKAYSYPRGTWAPVPDTMSIGVVNDGDPYWARNWVADGDILLQGASVHGGVYRCEAEDSIADWPFARYADLTRIPLSWFETRAISGVDSRGKIAYDRMKRWRFWYPSAVDKGGSRPMKISWETDFIPSTAVTLTGGSALTEWNFVWDAAPWDGTEVNIITRQAIGTRGKQLSMRFEMDGWDFQGVTIVYVLEERR